MKPTENIIAVNERIASAGAVTWWRLSGACQAIDLEDALSNHDIDPPERVSPQVALRRAVNGLRQADRLARATSDGYALVNETRTNEELGDGLDYEVMLNVKVLPGGMLKFKKGSDTKYAEVVETTYLKALDEFSSQDISKWLVRSVEGLCDGVKLRDTGGIYFIPSTCVPHWNRIKGALRGATRHTLCEVPAMHSDEAVDAILDAVQQETTATAEALEAEVLEGKIGERALETRVSRCRDMAAKVKRYEALLGSSMDKLTERLERLDASITSAILTKQTAKDKKAGSKQGDLFGALDGLKL